MVTVDSGAQHNGKANYFGTEMLFLKLFGYSLTGNISTPYRIYSFLFFFASLVYMLLDVYELTKHDFEVVVTFQIYISAQVIALAKGFVFYINRTKISRLLDKLQREPFLPDLKRGSDDEAKIVAECVWFTKMQARVYYSVFVVTITGNIFYIFFKRLTSSDYRNWLFPYGPFTAIDVTHSPNYEIACFYQNISLIYCSVTFATVDLLLASVLAHISYQFKILQNYIRQLVKISRNEMVQSTIATTSSSNETDTSIVPWAILKIHLEKAIRYHWAIINVTSEVEKLFSNMLLFAFVCTLSMLCFSIYTTSMATSNIQVAAHVPEAIGTSCQVLIICYWGEQVSHESNLVGQAAYEADFVGTDKRFQKALALIVRRSQNTSKVTAGKFTPVSLVTFSWVLRTSYSAFMVIRGANTPNIQT